jgi:hypothetical protein
MVGRDRRASRLPAGLVVVAGVASLFVVPVIAAPVLIIGSLAWRSGPKWARITLATAAALFVVFFLVTLPAGGT